MYSKVDWNNNTITRMVQYNERRIDQRNRDGWKIPKINIIQFLLKLLVTLLNRILKSEN